ncbi:MAG: pentatricopeptide repeat-containing protein, partial [Bacteroidota bacterium]
KPNEVTYNSLLTKAPNWNDALNIIQTMKREGLKPNEVTYNSLLTKAPNWNDALNIIQTIDESHINNRYLRSTFLKIAQTHQEETLASLNSAPKDALFFNSALRMIMREFHLPLVGGQTFYHKYFDQISRLEDWSLIQFIDTKLCPEEWKLRLVEFLPSKESNWWYHKIKADALLNSDHEQSFSLLKRAYQLVPDDYKVQVHAIWIKTVVLNDLENEFQTAIEKCNLCLKNQNTKGNFPYVGKLLVWLLLRNSTNVEAFTESLNRIIATYQISRRLIGKFLSKELWTDFPERQIEKYRTDVANDLAPNLMEKKGKKFKPKT